MKKSFYDFNSSNPQERQERNQLYPELAQFHIALREELGEEEYQLFYKAEKESIRKVPAAMLYQNTTKWITA
ncbi:hypothetical protein [Pontibacter sp. SGAir0037]|uniref:hypothetical protein n=1 Tax=Pontibacter sp. SGAir0037 TaxID=2571030 RepID=UPI0010CD418A|nr:hypothetical protein [Pontibacter sp. SGAir0037]QCR23359.1 hypothetical protein C1N53_14100 [Pontibacter sp. SGAir0037]